MSIPKPSSSTDGFFQEVPTLLPLYTLPAQTPKSGSSQESSDDVVLDRILRLYIPSDEMEPSRSIHNMARLAIDPKVLAHAVDAEVNRPVLNAFNTFGKENIHDPLWTSAGWKELKRIGQKEGIVSVGYENPKAKFNRRIQQFGMGHVWVCTGTMTGCPMSMTDGAAKLLAAHLDDPDGDQVGFNQVVHEAYRRLISREPAEAWTTGQWMTERSGGSDVSGTETVARRLTHEEIAKDNKVGRGYDAHGLPLGPWTINGFKWFSSATDSDIALMLAQTGKGLGLFLAPLRRLSHSTTQSKSIGPSSLTELNGIRIQRLKDKIGTKSLPTAELELKSTRAWLIGEEGKGVKEVSTILNLTRLHTAAGSVGYWSRGLQVSRAYSRLRKVRGGLLQDNPQHLRWMASNMVNYTAAAHFAFFGHAMLGAIEQGWETVVKATKASNLIPKDVNELSALFRLLTPVMKAQVSVASVHGLREHMECLGGVGYCENNEDGGLLNISKIYRDNLVSPIWEGTVSVMAEDVIRVLTDKRNKSPVLKNVLKPWVSRVLNPCPSLFAQESVIIEQRLEAVIVLEQNCSKEELLFRGRELLEHLEAIVSSILLIYDASTDGDEVATEVARRWIRSKALTRISSPVGNWQDLSAMDKKIFLGSDVEISQEWLTKL